MGIRLSFELSERDLDFFRDALSHCRDVVRDADESEIVAAIRGVIDEIRANEPLPDFVDVRLPELESMIEMLMDEEWQLPPDDREHLLSAFVYFGDPEDILPDDVPVIGYLDDVIVVELVSRELRHAREAYADFCRFRDDYDSGDEPREAAVRRDRLDRERRRLQQRMQRRARADERRLLR